MPEDSKVSRGRQAETRAANFLLSLGYTIITRNFQIRGGEIDLIALDGDELVFVEVRQRNDDMGEESIGPKKSNALRRTAQTYRETMGEERNFRFDLVVVSPQELRHHRDFFE